MLRWSLVSGFATLVVDLAKGGKVKLEKLLDHSDQTNMSEVNLPTRHSKFSRPDFLGITQWFR